MMEQVELGEGCGPGNVSLTDELCKRLGKRTYETTLARCRQNKLHSDRFLKSNNYTTLQYELIDLVREIYNLTSRITQ